MNNKYLCFFSLKINKYKSFRNLKGLKEFFITMKPSNCFELDLFSFLNGNEKLELNRRTILCLRDFFIKKEQVITARVFAKIGVEVIFLKGQKISFDIWEREVFSPANLTASSASRQLFQKKIYKTM